MFSLKRNDGVFKRYPQLLYLPSSLQSAANEKIVYITIRQNTARKSEKTKVGTNRAIITTWTLLCDTVGKFISQQVNQCFSKTNLEDYFNQNHRDFVNVSLLHDFIVYYKLRTIHFR